jgi:outer membrane immunogenic protein
MLDCGPLSFRAGFKMRNLAIGILAAAALSSSAFAADMAVKAPPAPIDSGYNWTGFYIGGNIGYSWGRSRDDSTFTNGAGTVLFASSGRSSLDGVVGGGQIGYNWQMQNWLWGFEADIQGTSERGSRDFTCPTGVCISATIPIAGAVVTILGPPVPVSLDQKLEWFGTVRGRAGVLVSPRVLLYATGGLAYGQIKSSETIGVLTGFSNSSTNVGYTVGAGIEGAIGGNWTAKLEYLYVDLGRVSGSFGTTATIAGGGAVTTIVLNSNYSSRVTDNVLRVGLNYRFGGAVVAKY